MKISRATRICLKAALAEDIGAGDATSRILLKSHQVAMAKVISRESGVFCGKEVAKLLAQFVDSKLRLRFFARDGSKVRKGQKLIEIRGRLQSILKLERTLLNLLAHSQRCINDGVLCEGRKKISRFNFRYA